MLHGINEESIFNFQKLKIAVFFAVYTTCYFTVVSTGIHPARGIILQLLLFLSTF